MLYLTTRSRTDSFTANRALREPLAPDGGAFLPFRFPNASAEEIAALATQSFGEVVAQQLSRFFPVKLTAWDVELAAGKNLISVSQFGRRIYCVRAWNSVCSSMDELTGRLYALLCKEPYAGKNPSGWAQIAIRISLLFGFTAEMMRHGVMHFDIACNDRDFDMVMAVWYARSMGLPIDLILCGCAANSALWEFIHKGECSAKQLKDYSGVEMLIYSTLGLEANGKYLQTSGTYKLSEEDLPKVNAGLFASVVGHNRITSLIQGVMRTDNTLIDPYMAIAYGALQDYRAKVGESNPTLMISTASPNHWKQEIIKATGISEATFSKYDR